MLSSGSECRKLIRKTRAKGGEAGEGVGFVGTGKS